MGRTTLVLLLYIVCTALTALGQNDDQLRHYSPSMNLHAHGFWVGLQVSGLRADQSSTEQVDFGFSNTYDVQYVTTNGPRLGLTAGYFIASRTGPIRTWNMGVGLTRRKGTEESIAERSGGVDVTFPETFYANGNFSQSAINIHLDPTMVWRLSRTVHLHHGPGIDFEWVATRNEEYGPSLLDSPVDKTADERYLSLTYGAGIGFRLSEIGYLRIGLRAALLHPLEEEGSGHRRYLSTDQKPYNFCIAYQWQSRLKGRGCPGVSGTRATGRFSGMKRGQGSRPW